MPRGPPASGPSALRRPARSPRSTKKQVGARGPQGRTRARQVAAVARMVVWAPRELTAVTVSLRPCSRWALAVRLTVALSVSPPRPMLTVRLETARRSAIVSRPWERTSDLIFAPFTDTPLTR